MKNNMLTIRIRKNRTPGLLLLVFYALLLQSALELLHPVFSYIDESFALLGIAWLGWDVLRRGTLTISRTLLGLFPAILVFLAVGLLGNLAWQFQPWNVVLIDLFTNLKFFLSVLSGWCLFRSCGLNSKGLVTHARAMAVLLFALLMGDLLFDIFPARAWRYGLRPLQLCWRHPTYLAGSMVFLLSVLTAFSEKQNRTYIGLCLILLTLTLRGKAIAGAVVYCLLFVIVILRGKPLRAGHFFLLALLVLAVAGKQFYYYYVQLDGQSARSVLTRTAFQVAQEYFPLGTGFGTYASSEAAKHYSPVYVQYGFLQIPELDGVGKDFLSDTFWPILLGQSGVFGTVAYTAALLQVFQALQRAFRTSTGAYAAGMFLFLYLLISSTSEPAFHNAVAVPLAMVAGGILAMETNSRKEKTI